MTQSQSCFYKIYSAQDNSQISNSPDNSPAQSWYVYEHQHEHIEVSKAYKVNTSGRI